MEKEREGRRGEKGRETVCCMNETLMTGVMHFMLSQHCFHWTDSPSSPCVQDLLTLKKKV